LLQNKSNANSTNKYCKNCQKSNHNTNECRYENRSIDTGQNGKPKTSNTKQETCAYCKKAGHSIEKCHKKKERMKEKIINKKVIKEINKIIRETDRDRMPRAVVWSKI